MIKTSKRPMVTCVSIAAVVGLGILWLACQTELLPNFGVEAGYYGQFNRVRHTIERMPDIRIVDHWMHKEVTLEDFGFVLVVGDGATVPVDFAEGSAQRAERNKRKIREFVERQIASSRAFESVR